LLLDDAEAMGGDRAAICGGISKVGGGIRMSLAVELKSCGGGGGGNSSTGER